MSLGSCCPLCGQLCDLPKEVLSQIVGLCRRDFRAMRQVNRCLKVAVDMEVRGIRIALQRGSGAEAADALDRKSPLALQRKYPKLRQVRDGWIKSAEYFSSCCRGDVMSLRHFDVAASQVILHGYGLGVITVFLRKINNWESLIIGGNPPAVHSSLSLEEGEADMQHAFPASTPSSY